VSDGGVVVCDLDGVVWLGGIELPGAAEAVARLRDAGLRVAFLTNNSSQTVAAYEEALAKVGIAASAADIATSAQAAAVALAAELPAGSRVLACADRGVVEALTERGFEVVATGPCDAVVVGYHRHFNYDGLNLAAAAVRAGARFVATNSDATYPGPAGLLPGNGSLVAAVATAAGRGPDIVAGKPHPATVALVRERFGARGVMVGDRPSTDGALALALEWPFGLVVSDVTASAEETLDVPAAFAGPSLAVVADAILAALGAD
jgi:4-nitrophenyl phosphatase